MSFYIFKNDRLQMLDFDYLNNEGGRRLDKTLTGLEQAENEEAHALREEADKYTKHYAIEVMTKRMEVLDYRASVAEALALCKKIGSHHLILCKDDTIKGMVSDRDISWLKKINQDKTKRVSHYMSDLLLMCDEETPIDHLAQVMVREKVSAFPVIGEDYKLSGIVTHNDLLRWIYQPETDPHKWS